MLGFLTKFRGDFEARVRRREQAPAPKPGAAAAIEGRPA